MINRLLFACTLVLLAACNAVAFTAVSSFVRTGSFGPAMKSRALGSGKGLYMFFGAPKDDGSPGDYVCKVRKFHKSIAFTFC